MGESPYIQPTNLVEQLGSSSRDVQARAYAVLMDHPLDQRTDVSLLVQILERLPENQPLTVFEKHRMWLSEKAKRALIAHGAEAVMPVITLLKDSRSYIRSWAADILGAIKDERAPHLSLMPSAMSAKNRQRSVNRIGSLVSRRQHTLVAHSQNSGQWRSSP